MNINIPSNIKIIIWRKKNNSNNNITSVFLYNNSKKFNFYINCVHTSFYLDKEFNSLMIERTNLKNTNKFINLFYKFLKSWDIYFFSKIKFKGKGFRIKFFKKIRLVKFYFGRSHKTFVVFKKIITKRINKYKFIIMNLNKNKINLVSSLITKIKPLNFYTLRGIRKSKQIVFKRKGKKGTYI